LLGYEPFGGNNANNLFTTISLLLEKRNFQRKNKRLKDKKEQANEIQL